MIAPNLLRQVSRDDVLLAAYGKLTERSRTPPEAWRLAQQADWTAIEVRDQWLYATAERVCRRHGGALAALAGRVADLVWGWDCDYWCVWRRSEWWGDEDEDETPYSVAAALAVVLYRKLEARGLMEHLRPFDEAEAAVWLAERAQLVVPERKGGQVGLFSL